MTWTIYSIGDSSFLQMILQGVALLCGADDFMASAKIATLLGAGVLFFRSLAGGGRSISLHEMLVAFVVYSAIFGVKVTVAIQSMATGAVITQAGVPVGFAAAGSIISLFGVQLTEEFEQAFSTPSMVQHGFQSSLNTIRVVRVNTMSVQGFGAANAPVAGADVYSSWVNYINECTIPMIESHHQTLPGLMNTTPFVNALHYTSLVNQTLILIGGQGITEPCDQAFYDLLSFSQNSFIPALLNQLAAPLGGATGSGGDATNIIGQALNAVGLGMTSVPDFVLTSVLVPIFYDTMSQSADATYTSAFATMVNDAQRARAAQWMGQSTMFNTYAQPMMAFLEGFQYAMMPLVLLLVLLGTGAIGVAGKFLGGLLWIQLWYPLLAIVNLFEQMALTGKMTAMMGAGTGALSLAGTLQADQSFLAWMGIGSYMATGVPVLAAAVAAGAWHGVDGLIGRVGGPENIVPEVAAPRKIGQQYSQESFAPLHTSTPTQGRGETGSEHVAPTLTYSSGHANELRSAQEKRDAVQSDLLGRAVRSYSQNAGVDERGSHSGSVSEGRSASYGQQLLTTLGSNASYAHKVAKAAGVSDYLGAQLLLEGAASYKGGMKGGELAGKLGGTLTDGTTLTTDQETSAERALQQVFSENPSLQSTLASSVAKDIRDNREHSVFASRNAGEMTSLEQSASHSLSAAETYQQAASAQISSGATLKVGAKEVVQAIRKHPGLAQDLTGLVVRYGVGREAILATNINGHEWRAVFGDAAGAEIMGQLTALNGFNMGGHGFEAGNAKARRAAFDEIVGRAVGADLPSPAGEDRNAARVQLMPSGPKDLPAAADETQAEAKAGLSSAESKVEGGREAVEAKHTGDLTQQGQDGQKLAAPVVKQMRAENNEQGKADTTPTTREKISSALDGTWRVIGDVADHAKSLVATTASGADAGNEHIRQRIGAYRHKGEAAGLTAAQARYFGVRAGAGLTYGPRDHELAAAGRDVSAEAKAQGLDSDNIIGRLNAAAVAPDDAGSARILGDLAETNQLNGLRPSPFPEDGALDQAVRHPPPATP